jgi:hypothetical protein
VRDSLVVVLLIFYRDAKVIDHFASTSLLQYPILRKYSFRFLNQNSDFHLVNVAFA